MLLHSRGGPAIVRISPLPSIEKPFTGLPVLAIPSTMRWSPARFNSDDHNSRYIWITPRPDHCAKEEIQVFSKLKTPSKH